MASATENRRGIIAMLLAMMLFVGNDTLVKLAREAYPAGQAIALRAVFAVVVGVVMVVLTGARRQVGMALAPSVLLRGLFDSLAAVSFIWALGLLPLANITAIVMASPILIVVIAVLLRIERVGWRRTAAIIVGFVGVLIVVRPSATGFAPAALVALGSAVLVAARDLATRAIPDRVPTTVVSLSATIFVGCVSLGSTAFEVWQPFWRVETAYLALAAVLVSAASFFIVNAFRNTDVGVISGYRYAVVVFAVAMGYGVWGEIPDLGAMLGIALIVGAGLYTMHRQRVRPDSNLKIAGDTQP